MKNPEINPSSEHDKITAWVNGLAELGQHIVAQHPDQPTDPANLMIPYSDRDGNDDNDSTFKVQIFRYIKENNVWVTLTQLQGNQVELSASFQEEASEWRPDTSRITSVSVDKTDGGYGYYAMASGDGQWGFAEAKPGANDLQDIDSFLLNVRQYYGLAPESEK